MTCPPARLTVKLCLSFVIALTISARPASAQNWSFDARNIGMGGVGSTGNLASEMIDKEHRSTAIVLPFGLFQVLSDRDIYDPNSPKFDPIRAIEYAASPLHYVVGRDTSTSAEALFVSDIRNATFSRDLSKYRGFVPANDILAEGLASPRWGGTIKVHRDADGGYQGIYIGAGPYLSQHITATFDQQLLNVLTTGVNAVNASMPITNADQGQVAMAITGGYRGRFALASAGSSSARDGLYVAANYNYLRGFLYENDAMNIGLATDRFGLLTTTSSVFIDRQHATSGTGFSLDAGAGVVFDHWEVGVGASGISNRIDWTGVERNTLRLASLTAGGGGVFVQSGTVAAPDARVELPVDYRGNVTYDAGRWSATAEAGHGFGGGSFHGGYEHRFGPLQARGGARYTFGMWNPTGGIGVDLSRKVSFDVAAFGTTTNIQRTRQLAIAASFRINHF
jgi:hypothetical protein